MTLTPSLSIRNSKYGPYIFYKTDKMKKPKFFDLKGKDPTSDDLLEWITRTYLHHWRFKTARFQSPRGSGDAPLRGIDHRRYQWGFAASLYKAPRRGFGRPHPKGDRPQSVLNLHRY